MRLKAAPNARRPFLDPVERRAVRRCLGVLLWDTPVMRATTVLLCALTMACSAAEPAPLTEAQQKDVTATLVSRGLTPPDEIEVQSTGFVVANYEIADGSIAQRNPRAFGEARLLAIREALLNDGYKNFRVNVNGPPPGTGLIRRYGSSRFIDGGTVEWITP
jgi:hypothetical protein